MWLSSSKFELARDDTAADNPRRRDGSLSFLPINGGVSKSRRWSQDDVVADVLLIGYCWILFLEMLPITIRRSGSLQR